MSTVHNLTNAFTRVAECFENDAHLDLSPARDVKLLSLHVTTAADLDLGPPMLEAWFKGDLKTFRKLEKKRLAAKPDMDELKVKLEAMERQRREEELLTPVKRVQVEFTDHFREKRFWNLTHPEVDLAVKSPAFKSLVETAKSKHFSTMLTTETFFNANGDLRLNLKLVFELPHHGGLARTFQWSERP